MCPSSRWCHSTISSSVVHFSSRLQSFPTSGSFQMSQFFASGGQSIGVSASGSVLLMNIQVWFPLGLTGLISLQSKGLSEVFYNTTVQKHQFFGAQLYSPTLTSIHDTGKTIALTRWTLVGKVMSLLFKLSRLVITFLPRRRVNFMAAVTISSDLGAPQKTFQKAARFQNVSSSLDKTNWRIGRLLRNNSAFIKIGIKNLWSTNSL